MNFLKGVMLASGEAMDKHPSSRRREMGPLCAGEVDASAQGINQIIWIIRPIKSASIHEW